MEDNYTIHDYTATAAAPLVANEDVVTDTDEPPEQPRTIRPQLTPLNLYNFGKTALPRVDQRASLLTMAIHADEDESSDEDEHVLRSNITNRGFSTASTWSNTSASTAGLTSDDGLTSPGTRPSTPSPQLPPASFVGLPPVFNKKPFDQPVRIRHEEEPIGPLQRLPVNSTLASKANESAVEATLGRKRCITFACGRKVSPKAASAAPAPPSPATTIEPTQRPRCIKFACPSKISTEGPTTQKKPRMVRQRSPAPPRQPSGLTKASPKSYCGSDSTVRHPSPDMPRKPMFTSRASDFKDKYDQDRPQATRFHEFASSEEEVDEWVQESTCHMRRLTVNDTLKIENGLRKLAEEVEEEDEEEDDDDDDEEVDEDDEEDDGELEDEEIDGIDADGEQEDDEMTDDGFQTDDEGGFAISDNESDSGSDCQWWVPGSTAATSAEAPEHIRPFGQRTLSESSVSSVENTEFNRPTVLLNSTRRKRKPLRIQRPVSPELPDSTDFVCGTLDEDRPLEEAYISCLERRRAAKHIATPQDIDPTFPTSDPELDDESEDEIGAAETESDAHYFMHGRMDTQDEEDAHGYRRSAMPKRGATHSPRRLRSPPPMKRVGSTAHYRSPPAPRLFGQSPRHVRSPPPKIRPQSPPPTRRGSLAVSPPKPLKLNVKFGGLAQRPGPTTSSSLPRTPVTPTIYEEESDKGEETSKENVVRRAIDIKAGLEKKRQRRKEKLYQKHIRKTCKEKERRPLHGKGAERMREMGLELAAYRGLRPTFVPPQPVRMLSF